MKEILALDLATVTGWCWGHVGDATPEFGSVPFNARTVKNGSRDDNDVFANCLHWITERLKDHPPDIMIMEAMLPPQAMLNKTSRQVRDRLAGLHGIVRASARRYGVGEIVDASVGDVRQHFLGQRHLKRVAAKSAVVERCKALGWEVLDDNAGDACAIWSYAVALIDPAQGLRVSPLFNRELRIRVQ